MTDYFKDFDFSDFWDDSAYSLKDYVGEYPTDEMIESVEKELGGYKLPQSYIALMRMHNGGTPTRICFPTDEPTGWAEDHIAITGIMGIGREKTYSLCGSLGSNFMIEEWEYPRIGICIADTPTAGHEMIMLDYRECGKEGEPQVVYVDQENDYSITFLAEDFETFICGLVSEEVFDTSEEDKQADLQRMRTGTFSPILLKAFNMVKDVLPDADNHIRNLAETIVEEKGFFALHADEKSYLMYDYLFWLYSSFNTAKSYQHYMNNPKSYDTSYDLPSYTLMLSVSIVANPYTFCTGGYAEGFVSDWWNNRIENGYITEQETGFRPSEKMEVALLQSLEGYK